AALLAAPAAGVSQTPVPPPPAAAAPADSAALSLDEAVRRAMGESQEVRLARSQVQLADAQVSATRAQALPQLGANLGYTRTFASAFSGGGTITIPDSLRFEPDPTLPLEQRVAYLEDRTPTAGLGGLGALFGDLPFGQENAYTATFTGSQLLYSGGRTGAALKIARSYRDAARLGLVEETAEIELQVRSAYYRALLARELEGIAGAALEQAEAFLRQEQLRQRAGRASELDVLRAEVARDNLRPQAVQARNAAELATLDLKRLVDLPLAQPVRLTTPLAPPSAEELARVDLAAPVTVAQRAALAAAERQVSIRAQQVRIAKGAFLPSVSVNMNYGKQLFPSSTFALNEDWRTDWTAGLSVNVPIFNGGQRTAELQTARVERERAELQLSQLREAVQLQAEQARGERERARSAIAARERTVAAAQRVYDLTTLRYNQGLATQLEVSQSRLELLQARSNLAQAIADFYVADAGLVRATGVGGTVDVAAPPADAVTPATPQPAASQPAIPQSGTPPASPTPTPVPGAQPAQR
ncbi:MAG: TolC family protein, partial [Longimicrobiaceae bacterium]